MKRWTWWAFLGTAVSLFGAVGAYRLARTPGGALPPAVAQVVEEPTALNRALLARSAIKGRLADDVIADRLSLLQAAAAFRDLDAQGPSQGLTIRDRFPGAASEEEAYCRSVIAYVSAAAPPGRYGRFPCRTGGPVAAWLPSAAPPGQADDQVGRLEAELDARLRDGTLILPRP